MFNFYMFNFYINFFISGSLYYMSRDTSQARPSHIYFLYSRYTIQLSPNGQYYKCRHQSNICTTVHQGKQIYFCRLYCQFGKIIASDDGVRWKKRYAEPVPCIKYSQAISGRDNSDKKKYRMNDDHNLYGKLCVDVPYILSYPWNIHHIKENRDVDVDSDIDYLINSKI